MTKTIPLSSVLVSDRARETNPAHAESLARSIRDNGLLQPIVLSHDSNRLIAGGHRFAAFELLHSGSFPDVDDPSIYSTIPYIFFEEYLEAQGKLPEGGLSPSDLKLYELEENCKRLDMRWQDRCKAVYHYHRLRSREARKLNLTWMQELTGKELGLDQGKVSRFLVIGKELIYNPTSPYHQCEHFSDALKLQVAQRLDAATRAHAKLVQTKQAALRKALPPMTSVPGEARTLDSVDRLRLVASPAEGGKDSVAEKVSADQVAGMFHQGDCLEVLKTLSKATTIHHIICDPPYGIDMANLECTDSVGRIESTHQVPDNLNLIQQFLQVAYDTIHEAGFLCMWYDLDHHEKIQLWAKAIGWKPCRWPFVWCKPTGGVNNAAQYNITKATEVCMFFRRSEKSILVEKQHTNYIVAPAISSSTHPFVKPTAVWDKLVRAVSREGQTIVDPFAGEGSSLESFFKLGRIPVGIELDEVHINNGVFRLYKNLNKQPDLLDVSPL